MAEAHLDQLTRSLDARIDDVDQSARTMVFKANTSGLDRFNSVIEPRGIDFAAYRKTPVFLWEHGKDPRRFTDPIGRGQWVRHSGGKDPKEVLVKKEFLADEFSDQRYQWYRDGVLNAVSVRVMPRKVEAPTREEMRARPELINDRPNETRGVFDGPLMIRECELLEISGTAVPGNADCLVVERAVKLLDFVGRGMLWMPEDVLPLIEARARTMTESTDGLAEGGGVVKPREGAEDRGFGFCPECGAPGETAGRCEAGHSYPAEKATRRSAPVVEEPPSARSAPWIETDGQTWTIYATAGRAVAMYEDASVAEESLRLMRAARPGQPGGYERELVRMLIDQRSANEQRFEDVISRLELQLFGRLGTSEARSV